MRKKRAFQKIIIAVFLVIFCIIGPAGRMGVITYGVDSYQGQIDDAKENKEKLEKEKKELEKKMAELKVEKSNLQKAIEQLDAEYMALSETLEGTELDIAAAETGLTEIETELKRMEQVAADQYEAMKNRVKYLYENGEDSLLSLFLGGSSIADIFNEMEYRSQITKYDKQLLARYNETIAEIELAERLQLARIEELEALKDYQQAELASLEKLSAEKAVQMEEMAKKLGIEQEELLAYANSISKVETELQELQVLEQERLAEIERKRKEAESKDIKNILWPLEGYGLNYITSKFGYRNAPTAGASTYHQGIDIGVPYGTQVHAALAGTVAYAGYNYQSGNYVVIDHGNGVRTWYAHASKILVKTGDVVKRDDVIMLVGSTGVSTGPHLHFSIYINGVTVDPLKYVKYNR